MKKYVFCLVLLSFCLSAFAEKVVRVGCFDSRFCHRDEFGRLSGYAYEFQRDIATYTGWRYEYVEDSWPNLFQMLKEGKIDLLSDVSFTEDRTRSILFSSYAMGVEKYLLYAPLAAGASFADVRNLEGKIVGVNKGSVQVGIFKKWESQMGIKAKIVELVDDESVQAAMLNSGKLDAIVSGDAYETVEQMVPQTEIGSSDIFFGVNKKRPDLLEELNRAMAAVFRTNGYYTQDLYKKYVDNLRNNKFLDANELEWLKKRRTIKVGYRDNYMAFCAKDEKTGELKGALSDYLKMMSSVFKNASIKFEPVAFVSTQASLDALKRGDVDCVFPINLDPYDSEKAGVLSTKSFAGTDMYAIVHKDNYKNFSVVNENVVAVNKDNPNYESFLQVHFPKWKPVIVATTDDALRYVSQKKATTLLVSNFRIKHFERKLDELNLFGIATSHIMKLSFAVRNDDLILYSILNRCISLIPREELDAALTSSALQDYNTSFLDVIKQNYLTFMIVGGSVLFVIVVLLVRTFRSEMKYKKANRQLESSYDHLKIALAAAQEASRAKTTFLNSMSHDIRTPMNGIIGMTAIATAHLDDPEKLKDCLKKISGASDHLLSLINDVLDVSRIESGRTTLNREEFAIDKMFIDITNMAQSLASQKRHNFVVDYSGLRNMNAVGDPLRLRQVILNILSNAIKYTPEGGTIKATLSELPSSTIGFADYLFVCEDNGLGMDPKYLEKIFEPFSRDELDENKRAIQGTGLGMSIARSLARMMDGDIRVDSVLGKGSRIEVPFKLMVGKEQSTGSVDDVSLDQLLQKDFSDKRILIVEDNELNMEIAKEFFATTKINFETAWNGKEAFSMYEEHDAGYYDMIFMDIQMPMMDGHQATRAIRSSGKSDATTIPIVAMSANAFTEDMETSKRSGMNDHIAKPINVSRLVMLMEKYLR
ncbi:amino acid-binding domain sensor hybrid histidine kinase [Fibrobacter sp. UWH9]|uniref:ATP-binding protein n=1 Tax=Fibrobacter sp. UWH9 TaxID=1896213 RepID=UPI000919C4FE|nr:transporter substrate-binding domain-containing protein [Fibrobacter sp. UWH9]SHH55877.1 amino acid-binding domain sensor hybrid histidine kinase [Fibrobacter sp. UWH9]